MLSPGLILLAAGGSARMGCAKQLLAWGGQSLVRRAATEALRSGCRPVVVVVGAEAERVTAELAGLAVEIVVNERWQAGMGGSIRRGIKRLTALAPDAPAAVVMLCDQPWVTAETIRRLLETHRTSGKSACASAYADTLGPPCSFAASWFDELRSLADAEGARRLLIGRPAQVAVMAFEPGAVDLDTPEDYQSAVGAWDENKRPH